MTTRKTRILHVVNNLNYGGMERVVGEIARRTDSSRFETHVLALGYLGHFAEGLEEFATLHVAPPMPKWSMLYPRTFARQLSVIAPDVVHMHSGVWYKTAAAASLALIPRQIYTDHGRQCPEPWINRTIDRRASRHTDVVVCVSDELKGRLQQFVRYPSRVCVIPNGVDTERYSPMPDDGQFRAERGIGCDVPIIGSVGRLEVVKGYEVLIRAFAQLRHAYLDSLKPELVLVGDGSHRPELEQMAKELGVFDATHFVGWRSDIEQIARSFTLFGMSSHSEGTSVSLLEAMSAGLCPVVTSVGGNASVLGPSLAHRLVPPSDPSALARALSAALLDQPKREHDGTAARTRVIEHFGLDSMVNRYESLYSGVNASGTCEQAQ